jgi:hypothetical protein
LVDSDTITVQLTAFGKAQNLFIKKITDKQIFIGNKGLFKNKANCYFTIYAERKDIEKLVNR